MRLGANEGDAVSDLQIDLHATTISPLPPLRGVGSPSRRPLVKGGGFILTSWDLLLDGSAPGYL